METKHVYLIIKALRDVAIERTGDDRMLMLTSANFMERLVRENADLSEELEAMKER